MATREQLYAALTQADDAGDTEAAEHFASQIKNKEYSDRVSKGQAAYTGATQGAAFGFGDEGAALTRAAFEPWVAPLVKTLSKKLSGRLEGSFKDNFDEDVMSYEGDFGDRYNRMLAEQRKFVSDAREDRPTETFMGELGAGVTAGFVGAGKTVANQTLRQAIPRLAATGAASGGVAGAGYSDSDNIEETLKDSGKGAALGATAGVVLPALGQGLMKAGRGMMNLLPGNAQKRAVNLINRTVTDDLQSFDIGQGKFVSLSRDEFNDYMAKNPGLTVMDAGDNMRKLGARVVESQTPSANTLKSAINDRLRDQYKRTVDTFARGMNVDKRNLPVAIEKVMSEAREQVKPVYESLRNTPITRQHKEALTQFTQSKELYPTLKQAMQRAVKIARDEGIDEKKSGWTVRHLDLVSQSLREMAESAQTGTGQSTSRSVRLDNLRSLFDDAVLPEDDMLRQARGVWRSAAADKEAAELAGKIFTENADFNAVRFSKMSASEKSHFRMRILEDVRKRLGNKDPSTTDITREFRNKPNMKEALQVAFGDDEAFKGVMQGLNNEQRMFDTYVRAVLRATPEDAAENNIVGGFAGATAASTIGPGGPGQLRAASLLSSAGQKHFRPMAMFERGTNEALAPMLMNNQLPKAPLPNPLESLIGTRSNALPISSGILSGNAASGSN